MKNDMSSRSATAALVLAGALASGCAGDEQVSRVGVERIGETTCSLSLNILSTDPSNPNGQVVHPMGFVYPVIVDCSTDLKGASKAQAKISYTRAASLSQPTTGTVQNSNIVSTQSQVANFASGMNSESVIGADVKPYYVAKRNPIVTVQSGSVVGNTSAEGRKEGGDLSLIEANASGNTEIAKKRAGDIRTQIIQALEKTGASVVGADKISTLAKVNPLTEAELGTLYNEALRAKGNGESQVMGRIAEYNAGTVTSPNLTSIIGDRRFAEATINYTATGVDRTVDTSNWNYAYWASVFALIAAAGMKLNNSTRRKPDGIRAS